MATCDIVTLMKQRLPEYIVNCFMSSGYDEIEVISTMDTSDKEHNKIEKFIQRKYEIVLNTIHFHHQHLNFHLGTESRFVIL